MKWLDGVFLPSLGGLDGNWVGFKRWNLITGRTDRDLLPRLVLDGGGVDCSGEGNFVGYSNVAVVLEYPDRDTHWSDLESFWRGVRNAALERNLQVFVTTVRMDSVSSFREVFGDCLDAQLVRVGRSVRNSDRGSLIGICSSPDGLV